MRPFTLKGYFIVNHSVQAIDATTEFTPDVNPRLVRQIASIKKPRSVAGFGKEFRI